MCDEIPENNMLKGENQHHSSPAWHTFLRERAGYAHSRQRNILRIHPAAALTRGYQDRLHNPGANSEQQL